MENRICMECGTKDTYEFRNMIREYEGDGYHFELPVSLPFCKKCGAPIYDEELEKNIVQIANKKIREQREIITREEILEILETYHVSQKFLSKLLGWGEITLTRYISGNYTPNHFNSSRLKELKNPYVFQMLLQNYYAEHEGRYEEKSLKKAENSMIVQLKELKETQGKIFDTVNWFLAQSSDDTPITHLALQKLLYFTQSWSMVLSGEEFFDDDCQAWAHGAVYPKVYFFFKQFKYRPLPKVEKAPEFENNNLKILNAVKSYYYDIYTAKALEKICHREKPYIDARKGCAEGKSCNTIIDKKSIFSYYKDISQKYNISFSNIYNIKNYLNSLLNG
ncbi:MAG: DUF4065 domain-containing protein [Eubacterium sp.]|jgi:uncharacterized phage-associated protein|nr:DUF4065 domain-containing protein [Eubacterium sp.]